MNNGAGSHSLLTTLNALADGKFSRSDEDKALRALSFILHILMQEMASLLHQEIC